MKKFDRLCNPLLSNSFFLFGARGTGKSSLLADLILNSPDFDKAPILYDFLVPEVEERFSLHPSQLAHEIALKKPEC